ncbi:glycoside hydrolase family 16 protein [Christiangramia echinicola]|nr:glycoside hydrolase family 16 protein [Christiangramia echinicola]
MQLRLLVILFLVGSILGCSGSSSDDDNPITKPTDLEVTVDIVGKNAENPNGDGSGRITVNFSATNARSYKVSFGNGDIKETTSNSVTYTYVGKRTDTYDIYVSAYNADQFISKSVTVTIYVSPALTFADEFESPGAPDSSKWGYDEGTNGGWGNNESQYYTTRSENVIVEDGYLKITAKKENYMGANYTSARLKTFGKFDFTYGKIEVRAKLPQGGGTWPAIWMLGSNFQTETWPACGEIDIMEHVGNELGKVHATLHTPSSFGASLNSGTTQVSNVATEFHVYSAEWTAQKIDFAVDGTIFYTYNPQNKNANNWPFDKDQFIILNIAMGGNFGGNIDPDFQQSSMLIDYVRVYQ